VDGSAPGEVGDRHRPPGSVRGDKALRRGWYTWLRGWPEADRARTAVGPATGTSLGTLMQNEKDVGRRDVANYVGRRDVAN
jgi:hypothetical protein